MKRELPNTVVYQEGSPDGPVDPATPEDLFGATDAGGDGPADELHERYAVGAPIGSGGMGDVSVGVDRRLGRKVAVKVSQPLGPGTAAIHRFLREARITSQLEHPNIPPVHDVGVAADGRVFFAMKRVRGKTLAKLISDGELSLSRLLEVFIKVCDAVAYAHSRNVIHRDLKPANVMVGSFGRVYVLDWGIARVVGEPAAEPVEVSDPVDLMNDVGTQDGQVIGTLRYMSPEQARGDNDELDQRSDIYSLGVVLYKLLSGASPYPSRGLAVQRDVVVGKVTPIRKAKPDVPWELAAVVQRAMALDPTERYPTATQMRDDLQNWLEQKPLTAAKYSTTVLFQKWLWRHRQIASAVGFTAGLAGVALTGALLLYVRDINQALDRALSAEVASQIRLADREVALAEATAGVGRVEEALHLIGSARDHYTQAGLSTQPADLQHALILHDAPPPLIEWKGANGGLVSSWLSPDASQVATWHNGEISLFDGHKGALILERPSAAPPVAVAWGEDLIVVVRDGNGWQASRLLDGEPVWHFDPQVDLVEGTDKWLSQDAAVLLLSVPGHGSSAWDTASGEKLFGPITGSFAKWMTPNGRYACLQFSPNRLRAPTEAAIVAIQTGEVVHRPGGPACGKLSNNGLYTDELGDRAVVVELASGDPLWTISGRGSRHFSPDDSSILVFDLVDRMVRRDARTGEVIGSRRARAAPTVRLTAVEAMQDGSRFATREVDSLALWAFPDVHFDRSFQAGSELKHLALSPSGELIATCDMDSLVRIWHWRTGLLLREQRVGDNGLRVVRWTDRGRGLLVAGRDGVATRLLIDGTAAPISYGEPGEDAAMSVQLVDGRVYVGMEDGRILVWDAASGERIREIATPLRSLWALEIDRSRGRIIVSGRRRSDPTGAVLDLETGTPLWVHKDVGIGFGVDLAADGSIGFARLQGPPLLLSPTLEEIPWVDSRVDGLQSMATSPDGKLVALGDFGGVVHVHRRSDGRKLLSTQPTSTRAIVGLAFTASSTTVLAGSGAGVVFHTRLDLAALSEAAQVTIRVGESNPPLPSALARARSAAAHLDWEGAWGLYEEALREGQDPEPLEVAAVAAATGRGAEAHDAITAAAAAHPEFEGELAIWLAHPLGISQGGVAD